MGLHTIGSFHALAVQGLAPALRLAIVGPIGLKQIAMLIALAGAPFAIWFGKRRFDRWEESRRREDARRCAVDVAVALSSSIQLCESVRLAIQTAERLPDETVEAAIESLERSRQMLRLYLRRHIPLHELIPLAAAAEKRLGEGRQAMLTLQSARADRGERDALYAGQLPQVRAELESIVERLQRLQPDLGRAIAKVDAGWGLTD